MASIYKLKVFGAWRNWIVEIVAENERDSRLHAAHAHRAPIKKATIIETINNNYNGDYYMKCETFK